jgi:preprotein translocase subunit Sss1
MGLATTVSLVVICVMAVVGTIGFLIDRHASKLEP